MTVSTIFRKIDDYRWELPKTGAMRVPGLIYAAEKMLPKFEAERVAEQVSNVATLPGIVGYSLAMPDAHWGYGMPVGGVAAIRADDGVISPGAVGYDISCGVRLLRSDLLARDIRPNLPKLMPCFDELPLMHEHLVEMRILTIPAILSFYLHMYAPSTIKSRFDYLPRTG